MGQELNKMEIIRQEVLVQHRDTWKDTVKEAQVSQGYIDKEEEEEDEEY